MESRTLNPAHASLRGRAPQTGSYLSTLTTASRPSPAECRRSPAANMVRASLWLLRFSCSPSPCLRPGGLTSGRWMRGRWRWTITQQVVALVCYTDSAMCYIFTYVSRTYTSFYKCTSLPVYFPVNRKIFKVFLTALVEHC